jgi:hypothetical protein
MPYDINRIIRYFDLQSAARTGAPVPHAAGGTLSAPVFPQYAALVLGVVVQPYLHYYVEHGSWALTYSTVIGRIVFGVFVGLIALPGVYKNAFDPEKPIAVQLCAVFAAGLGWQSLIQAGAKAIL